ncbi:hypothetical protein TWF718_002384 [Orbilia javanica]|uniref:Uncharacterized protein n=1 Tax=Orbilia javanica TaxID=47235 RepID=A0AAN8MQG2_9PEZI
MSSIILQIPREIRDSIYSYLFELCRIPSDPKAIHPTYDSEASPSQQKHPLFATKRNNDVKINYHRALPKYQLLPILQTCQQIRAEFQDFLRRVLSRTGKDRKSRGKGLRYELNLISSGFFAYPVWSALPLPPEEPYNIIDELQINYQVRSDTRRRVQLDDERPQTDPYTLSNTLSDFIFHGPQGFYLPAINDLSPENDEEKPRYDGGRCKPKIKNLILNISFETPRPVLEKFARLEAEEKSGKAWGVLKASVRTYEQYKLSAAADVEGIILMMNFRRYFDGNVEKISILFEGSEGWTALENWDEDYLPTHTIIVLNGFKKNPDWKEPESYVEYGFDWGPRPECQRDAKPKQQDNE